MRKMRRLPALLCVVLTVCMLLCACKDKKQPEGSAAPTAAPTAAPRITPTPAPTPTPTPMPVPDAQAEQCVGAYFKDVGGSPNYYAAVEFTNTGTVPAVVESISVKIVCGETTVRESFVPPLAESDIIAPGERSTAAVWIPYEGKAPKEGEAITVTAEVTLLPTAEECKNPLGVENVTLVQNYPSFSTVSGTLTNLTESRDYDLTLVYLSFYDESGALLGVAHFTKNLAVPAAESRDFVMHLRSLPIEGLTEKTFTIAARGVGIR